jgi:competence protein ComFC
VTVPQVELPNKDMRLSNMNNVFGINKPAPALKGSTILLFDDVFTTGATMRSAANVLKRGGAKVVWAVTMAR